MDDPSCTAEVRLISLNPVSSEWRIKNSALSLSDGKADLQRESLNNFQFFCLSRQMCNSSLLIWNVLLDRKLLACHASYIKKYLVQYRILLTQFRRTRI